jgi:hypothetical protein
VKYSEIRFSPLHLITAHLFITENLEKGILSDTLILAGRVSGKDITLGLLP